METVYLDSKLRDTGKYYRVHFLSCDGIIWNHTGAGYRDYSRKGREDEKEVERFSRFCEEFANYEREPGQDMTLLVTADGKAVKKILWRFGIRFLPSAPYPLFRRESIFAEDFHRLPKKITRIFLREKRNSVVSIKDL